MKEADLFVLSSISEGLGMVLLEAIVCGTKVVSTDCDGVRDVMKGDLAGNLQNRKPRIWPIRLSLLWTTTASIMENTLPILCRRQSLRNT